MECPWANSVAKFCKVGWSYCVAIARLIVWTIILFFSGLQRTLFMRSEVVRVDFKVTPLRCDMEDADDKLAYIDKLFIENPDLIGVKDDSSFDDAVLGDSDFEDEKFDNNGEDENEDT